MGRFFVAIEIPPDTKTVLTSLVPRADGIRPVRAEALHLTLRFLGDTDPAPVAVALGTVRAEPFRLEIRGLGRFGGRRSGGRGRPAVVWAGVCESRGLKHLHAEVESRLALLGWTPETRPFQPHITLARTGPRARRDVLDATLEKHRDLALPPFRVESFTLFSSELRPTGAVHTPERVYPLRPGALR